MNIIKIFLKSVRRWLGLTPMRKVVRELKSRGVELKSLNGLEIFGHTGEYHTRDYFSLIASLEVWELNECCEKSLRKNLPGAKIKITDSFKAIKATLDKYNLIVADNPISTFDIYCEHFDLFPDIFKVAQDETILILNVIPEISEKILKDYPYLFNKTQLERRAHFYSVNNPEKISFDMLAAQYEKLGEMHGFKREWFFFIKRNFVYYHVLKLKRVTSK